MNEEQAPLPVAGPFDPYEGSRHMPWMDRSLSPSARAARMLRPELENFAVIEGREPNLADLDAMSGRISVDMIEILRREWAADVVNEWLEERDAAREGRPVDPAIGPKPQPIGGGPRDTSARVFVAEPEDIDWVMDRLGRRQLPFGSRRGSPPRPGMKPFRPTSPPPPPIVMSPAAPGMPTSPPPSTAVEPTPPIPPTAAPEPLLPDFEALIPPDLKKFFQPIPGGQAIGEGDQPFYIPGPLIGDPGLLVPIHIFSVRARSQRIEKLALSGLVDPDRLIEIQPLYGELEELVREAGRIVGPGKGGAHGSNIHHELTKLIKAKGYEGIRTEASYDEATGEETRYGASGSMRIDIIYDDGDTVYIFELKTGGAALKEPRIDHTLNLNAFKNRKVIVMELNPWRLPRK